MCHSHQTKPSTYDNTSTNILLQSFGVGEEGQLSLFAIVMRPIPSFCSISKLLPISNFVYFHSDMFS